MSRFYFSLRACGNIHRDTEGAELADVAQARVYATEVARELMRNAGHGTRHWSMCVEDVTGQALFDLFFSDLSEACELLPSEIQHLRRLTCRRHAALVDTMSAVRATLAESRMLRARITHKPQLAFTRGGPRETPSAGRHRPAWQRDSRADFRHARPADERATAEATAGRWREPSAKSGWGRSNNPPTVNDAHRPYWHDRSRD